MIVLSVFAKRENVGEQTRKTARGTMLMRMNVVGKKVGQTLRNYCVSSAIIESDLDCPNQLGLCRNIANAAAQNYSAESLPILTIAM
jgi:hypothetical protein